MGRPADADPTVEMRRDDHGASLQRPPADGGVQAPVGSPQRTPATEPPARPRTSAGPLGTPVNWRDREWQSMGTEAGSRSGGPITRKSRRRSRWRWVRRGIYALLAIVIVTPLFVAFRVWFVAREDSHRRSDAIIVLGAAQYNGTPSPVLAWRLVHALSLYQEGVAPAIVTVGGNQQGDLYTEAGTGMRWLNEHGVPLSRLVAVRTGSDTLQSMQAVGREYQRRGWHSGTIVTDPWHSLRSRTMAKDNGIDAVTSPTRSGPIVQTRGIQFNYIVRETGGYLYYVLLKRWHGGPS